jgi:hypothetical protein
MAISLLMVALTALLTSACTIALALWIYDLQLRSKLEKRLAEVADELEARVRKGVRDAGIELLPAFQEKVEDGFKNAMLNLPEQGASSIARAGASLIGEGLSTLFGNKKDR